MLLVQPLEKVSDVCINPFTVNFEVASLAVITFCCKKCCLKIHVIVHESMAQLAFIDRNKHILGFYP